MVESKSNKTLSLDEAEKLYKRADQCIKTGLLKWSADYLEGAPLFEKAGKAFK
jgi:hypothetical protein